MDCFSHTLLHCSTVVRLGMLMALDKYGRYDHSMQKGPEKRAKRLGKRGKKTEKEGKYDHQRMQKDKEKEGKYAKKKYAKRAKRHKGNQQNVSDTRRRSLTAF